MRPHAFEPEQPPLGRRADELREPAAVETAVFLAERPAVGLRHDERRAQHAREPRDVDPLRGDLRVEPVAILAQQRRADLRGRLEFAVVARRVRPIRGAAAVQHDAVAGLHERRQVDARVVEIDPQREIRQRVVLLARVFRLRFDDGRARVADHRRNAPRQRQRVTGERALVVPAAAQPSERHADFRHDRRARRFDQVFRFLEHGPAGQPRPRDLRDRVDQDSDMRIGLPRPVKRARPGFETMTQVQQDATQRGRRERFAAQLLEHLEQHAFDRIVAGQRTMQVGIGVQDAQRRAVGRAAPRREIVVGGLRAQVRRMDRQRPQVAAHAARTVMQRRIARQRPHGRRAQRFARGGAPRRVAIGAHRPAPGSPPPARDATASSSPKQRW